MDTVLIMELLALAALVFAAAAFFTGRFLMAKGIVKGLYSRLRRSNLLPATAPDPQLLPWSFDRPIQEAMDGIASRFAGVYEERNKLRQVAQSMSSSNALPALLQGDQGLAGKASRRNETIMFADIRGFTPVSERLQPETVLQLLNGYLVEMTKVIHGRGGRVNKFIGDGILAVFDPAHGGLEWNDAQRACLAALEMQTAFKGIAEAWGYYLPDGMTVGLGIGIHTGEVVEGRLGSTEKMEFAVIGDTVNTSSRVCGLAPAGAVWASYDTTSNLKSYFTLTEMEPLSLKGKALPLAVYRVVGLHPQIPAPSRLPGA